MAIVVDNTNFVGCYGLNKNYRLSIHFEIT